MSPDTMLSDLVTDLLLEEADCLDERRWRDWLDLYDEEAVFWAPSWHDDETLIDNPRGEISLIYCGSKERIEERVWRIESGMSSSLVPLPRPRPLEDLPCNGLRRKGHDAAAGRQARFHQAADGQFRIEPFHAEPLGDRKIRRNRVGKGGAQDIAALRRIFGDIGGDLVLRFLEKIG